MSVETISAIEKKDTAPTLLKPASWLTKIDFIKHLTLENNILISLLGAQGSGKTTFVSLLQSALARQVKSYVITASPSFDRSVFLQQLGIMLDGNENPSLSDFVAQQNTQKTHALLIIDDAQYLSAIFIEEILRALQQQGEQGYFHVCLVSNFSMIPTLNELSQNVYADMVHSIELGSLNENEVKAYVSENMPSLPGAEKLITDERIKQFYELTGGKIEGINRQMAEFFSYPSPSAKPSYKPWVLRYIGVAAGVFFAATGIVYLALSPDFQSAPVQLSSLETPAQTQAKVAIQAEEPTLNSDIPDYRVAATVQIPQTTSLKRAELAVANGEEDLAPDESLVVMDKVVVAPKVLTSQPKSVAAKTIKRAAPAVAKLTPQKSAKAVAAKVVASQGQYTIQLMGSHSPNTLKHFAKEHHLAAKTKIRRTEHQGEVWYVLTIGEYTQPQQAKLAVNSLPKDVMQFRPWVRLIADLKTVG